MIIQTKYKLSQTIWFICNKREQIDYPCPTCKGVGEVKINDTPPRSCPDCWGKRIRTKWEDTKWLVELPMVIGQVRCEITGKPDEIQQKNQYMCYESGIGTGSIYFEKDLFPTKESAEAECKERNKLHS